MKVKRILVGGGTLLVLLAIAGTAIAATGIIDDNEKPITGEALQKASAAALEYTGGGYVSETEEGDEDSYYEVEVTMPDGRQVDVQLDRQFKVVSDKVDSETDN